MSAAGIRARTGCFSPAAWAHQYTYTTPIDEYHIRRFFLQGRNFRTAPEMDAPVDERNLVVVDQDKQVVTRLAPFFTPESNTEEVMVKADTVIGRFREKLKSWEAMGWRIDTAKVNELRDKKAFAIPSPARRELKGWALDPVPRLTPAGAEQAAAE